MNVTPSNKDMQNQHQGVQCTISSADDEYNAQQLESLSPSKQRQETEDGVNKFVSPGDDKDDINYSQGIHNNYDVTQPWATPGGLSIHGSILDDDDIQNWLTQEFGIKNELSSQTEVSKEDVSIREISQYARNIEAGKEDVSTREILQYTSEKKRKQPEELKNGCLTSDNAERIYRAYLSWRSDNILLPVDDIVIEAYRYVKSRPDRDLVNRAKRMGLSNFLQLWAEVQVGNEQMLLYKAVVCRFSKHLVRFLSEAFPQSCFFRDENGMVPLHHAFTKPPYTDIAMILLDACPETSMVPDNQGTTPFLLLKRVASQKDKNGMFPVHRLSTCAGPLTSTSLSFLYSACPDSIAVRDNQGMLPFHHACLNPATPLETLMLFVKLYPESVASIHSIVAANIRK